MATDDLRSRVDALEDKGRRDKALIFRVLDVEDPNAAEVPAERIGELRDFVQSGLARARRRKNFSKEFATRAWQALVPVSAALVGWLSPGVGKFIQAIWHRIFG